MNDHDYYDLPLSNNFVLIYYIECIQTCDPQRNAGSGVSDRNQPNIWILRYTLQYRRNVNSIIKPIL